jgi:hypothetical protein
VVLASPLKNDPLSLAAGLTPLLDNVAANSNPIIPGRVNINQASRSVLMGIPGMTEEIVERILSDREPEVTEENPERKYETWLLSEGVVTLDEMKQLTPYICGGGDVWRVHVVGFYDQGGPAARVEALIDASGGTPRLLFWRDVSHLGRGFPLMTLGAVPN